MSNVMQRIQDILVNEGVVDKLQSIEHQNANLMRDSFTHYLACLSHVDYVETDFAELNINFSGDDISLITSVLGASALQLQIVASQPVTPLSVLGIDVVDMLPNKMTDARFAQIRNLKGTLVESISYSFDDVFDSDSEELFLLMMNESSCLYRVFNTNKTSEEYVAVLNNIAFRLKRNDLSFFSTGFANSINDFEYCSKDELIKTPLIFGGYILKDRMEFTIFLDKQEKVLILVPDIMAEDQRIRKATLTNEQVSKLTKNPKFKNSHKLYRTKQ